MDAQGSTLTNKYAEGYPGQRYYGGCEHADTVEELAIDRAKELWGAEHVNVQPHSGSQANMAVYIAALEPGDKILSLDLTHGGHLSHGHHANFVGEHFEVQHYECDDETGYVDYEGLREQAEQFDPDMIVSGYSAYPREVEWERIQSAAAAVDALHLADIAHITGLVAAGEHDSPVGIADFVTGSTHKTIRAGRGGMVMCGEEWAEAVDKAVIPGMQGGPLMHNIAGKAVGFKEALTPEFEEYAARVVTNAEAMAERLRERGLDLVSGGTDTHLVLADLRPSHPTPPGRTSRGRWRRPASSSTPTRCPARRARRSTPPGSASGRPRSPRGGSPPATAGPSPTASPTWSTRPRTRRCWPPSPRRSTN
ncbi:serine hydroxymethyltransferase [Halolamina pelagica]|uniref:Serine hydroxymethyltransferase n=1 Tax=Halolamina pelagica TaxID=699431 RepID=A0A0P7GRZ0_9EURY|nr:serine hydroxymethyltransferase [Halolamina pelagica]